MSNTCLFCGRPEKGYTPSMSLDFICSRCVQLLLAADQGDIERAYEKAVHLGFVGKATAIETFLVEKGDNAETEESERGMVRERFVQEAGFTRDQVRAQPST
jgi:hypothetical protein